jgi:hypothetical protein
MAIAVLLASFRVASYSQQGVCVLVRGAEWTV